MGYSGFKQKFSPLFVETRSGCKRARIAPGHKARRRGRGALGDRVSHRGDHSRGFFFVQENVDKFWNSRSPSNGSRRINYTCHCRGFFAWPGSIRLLLALRRARLAQALDDDRMFAEIGGVIR